MAADILSADGAAATIGPPAPDEGGHPSAFLGYTAIPGQDELIVLTASASSSNSSAVYKITATGYDLTGNVLSTSIVSDINGSQSTSGESSPTMALLANGDIAFGYNVTNFLSQAGDEHNDEVIMTPAGAFGPGNVLHSTGSSAFQIDGPAMLYATATGFNMEWNAETSPFGASDSQPQQYAYQTQSFDLSGHLTQGTSTSEPAWNAVSAPPRATAFGGAGALQVTDNMVQYFDGSALLHAAVAIPGEPAHAITDQAAAMLAGGRAAVAWVDSGTDYVALFDPSTNSFGQTIGLDWGGASDVHAVALQDGGFVVSWMNGGAYKGEVFTADGTGGGIISLAGDAAGIDSHGDLYTVALNASGAYEVQTYAVGGQVSGPSVHTSDANYSAPFDVTTIYLTSANQTIQANARGDTIWSDNTQNTLLGGTGNDVFHLGRGGDAVTGGGGADTFAYAEIPWSGGTITDFAPGDTLDLTGLASTTQDTGSNGFADGYLKLANDAGGDAQVWARYANAGSSSDWWLVTTLHGVPSASLQTNGDLVTAMSGQVVSTSAANYTAGPNVAEIHLTGSSQTINASGDHEGVTVYSDNTINGISGSPYNDVFYLGRGGDAVNGGGGADTFVYEQVPWRMGGINGFSAADGDRIDVRDMLGSMNYTGSDPVTDGYLRIVDSNGSATIEANFNQPNNNGWWDVTHVWNVPAGSLHYDSGWII